ncbi:hypothetical protein [Microbacterium sp. CSI-V]|uniref:hypothetical protein n=1 Tax=Microbacterium sp. CSI-V TaxID=1933777 RepID=UPI001589A914|nr:hypothetical protein [Microbacterium sp. CSI-V]
MNPVKVDDVRRDDAVTEVVESPAPKGLIFLVGVLGFLVVVELGVAVAVTL